MIPFGIDTMDSCYPTRVARHGELLTSRGPLRITSTAYVEDYGPIDPAVPTIAYSRAYVHHLFKQKEPLAVTLASLHNLCAQLPRLIAIL